MTFDLTPEQQALVAGAATLTSLPRRAMDAVLAIEERTALRGSEDALNALGGRRGDWHRPRRDRARA
jgi:alkylhydroperoxidase family enzyme